MECCAPRRKKYLPLKNREYRDRYEHGDDWRYLPFTHPVSDSAHAYGGDAKVIGYVMLWNTL